MNKVDREMAYRFLTTGELPPGTKRFHSFDEMWASLSDEEIQQIKDAQQQYLNSSMNSSIVVEGDE